MAGRSVPTTGTPRCLFFVQRGYRVVGIDRRGHGRSAQVSDGHDMDHYAADAAAVVEHLDLRDAVHIGHSTGGGEVARYVARHGKARRSASLKWSRAIVGISLKASRLAASTRPWPATTRLSPSIRTGH
jgi:non-heme chloroperoxidase